MVYHLSDGISAPRERIELNGQLIEKSPGWYRKDYNKPAPIPVVLGKPFDARDDEPRIERFWPHDPSELLYIPAGTNEALKIDRTCGIRFDTDIFLIKWTKEELYKEMVKYPLTKDDIDVAMSCGLRAEIVNRLPYSVRAKIDFADLVMYFSMHGYGEEFERKEMRFKGEGMRDIAHEFVHLIYRVGETDLRAMKEKYSFLAEDSLVNLAHVEDIINFEAERICLKTPEVVDYAIEKLGLESLLQKEIKSYYDKDASEQALQEIS